MQITIVVSTDKGAISLKRTFTVPPEKRDECIHAAATLLNVSMSAGEELGRKGTATVEKNE